MGSLEHLRVRVGTRIPKESLILNPTCHGYQPLLRYKADTYTVMGIMPEQKHMSSATLMVATHKRPCGRCFEVLGFRFGHASTWHVMKR